MNTDFQLRALPRERFESALNLGEGAELPDQGTWLEVDAHPGYPCRVSLQDARVGERVLALNYLHHDVDSPYRASGPIFVRAGSVTSQPAVNEIPEMFLRRDQSVRGYDKDAMMIAAAVATSANLRETIEDMFRNPNVLYLHLHNASPGCFNCAVTRA